METDKKYTYVHKTQQIINLREWYRDKIKKIKNSIEKIKRVDITWVSTEMCHYSEHGLD